MSLHPFKEAFASEELARLKAELVELKDKIREQETCLTLIGSDALVGFFDLSEALEQCYWSAQLYVFFSRDPQLGPPPFKEFVLLVHPEDVSAVIAVQELALRSGVRQTVEFRTNPSIGPQRTLFVMLHALKDVRTGEYSTKGTVQDLTERRYAENLMHEADRKLQRLIEHSNDLICVLDQQGVVMSFHGAVELVFGYKASELVGQRALDFMHPDDASEVLKRVRGILQKHGAFNRVEYRFRHKQGHYVSLEAVGTNWVHDPLINGIVINIRDISERKKSERDRAKLQEQLLQSMKMEAVGRLAGGIAHDFNNLLTVIAGNAELVRCDLQPDSWELCYINEIMKAGESASDLTRRLLALSRQQIVQPRVLNLNDIIRHLHMMLTRLIGENIVLDLKLEEPLGSVLVDPGQFDQVLINLVVNARDAIATGGRITMLTENKILDESYCYIHPGIKPGHYVMVAVSDNGCGMTPEVKRRLYEPFFTTKPMGKGTGLGLAMIFGAVQQAEGTIDVYSEPGQGTVFKIFLPRVSSSAQRIKDSDEGGLPRGGETIMLVEDDASVRTLSENILRRLGYKLLVARNGSDALKLAAAAQISIDLLLTDVVMPSMGGRELSEQLKPGHGGMKVLFTSGYTEDIIVRHGVIRQSIDFIGKPYSMRALAHKIREVLDVPGGRGDVLPS